MERQLLAPPVRTRVNRVPTVVTDTSKKNWRVSQLN